MSNINTVALSGNATRDPELKTFESGSKVAKLGLAVNRSRKDPNGDGYIEEASFFDVEVFGNYADVIFAKVRKGDAIVVHGRLEQQSWETDGQKRSKVVVIANQLDGACFYKKAEDVAPIAATETGGTMPAAGENTTDDIPF